MNGPEAGDEVRLFRWNSSIADHDVYRALVRNVDTLGGAGGQHPRLDLSYSISGAGANENNVRNYEAFVDFNAITFWRNTHSLQSKPQSLPYASYDRPDTYEGRVIWIELVASGTGSRKAIITAQRSLPGNRVDLFHINAGAGTRVATNNVKALEDANVETEDHWFRRRLHRGAV